jgi:DNA-binding NarL/FixJ family response regulator
VTNSIRVLLVDDNVYFLIAARGLLGLSEALEVIDSVTCGREALNRVPHLQPDIILLDLNLGEQSGLELIPQLKEANPQGKIIVLTMMEDEPYREAALRAGADAFARKSKMGKALIPLILELANYPTDSQKSQALGV